MRGRGPALRNPYFCNACDQFIAAYPGGAEVTLSMVFVDVRRSTQTASSMSATAFHDYLRGFFNATHRALFETDGFVTEFRGDCAVGSYPPAMSGPDHAAKAVRAAQILLGDGAPRSRDGDDVPIGIGVHTGRVFIGTISDLADANKQNVSILGDNANIAALLAQSAAAGEALLSVETLQAAGRPVDPGSLASLELKGRPRPQAAVRMMAS
jgi:adenylate cyclase